MPVPKFGVEFDVHPLAPRGQISQDRSMDERKVSNGNVLIVIMKRKHGCTQPGRWKQVPPIGKGRAAAPVKAGLLRCRSSQLDMIIAITQIVGRIHVWISNIRAFTDPGDGIV